MVDSVQGLLILVLTMPGFFGYLCFNRIYDGSIEDAFEKAGLVVGFNVAALGIGSLFGIALPQRLVDARSELTVPGVFDFVVGSLVVLGAIAVVLGILSATLVNRRGLNALLVKLGLTRKLSAHSVLAEVLQVHGDRYLRAHFKSGGYVTGYPQAYSLDGEESILFLADAAIGTSPSSAAAGGAAQPGLQRDVDGAGVMLLNFDEVIYAELV